MTMQPFSSAPRSPLIDAGTPDDLHSLCDALTEALEGHMAGFDAAAEAVVAERAQRAAAAPLDASGAL